MPAPRLRPVHHVARIDRPFAARSRAAALGALTLLSLAACGDHAPAAADAFAARVNGEEIPLRQVDGVLAQPDARADARTRVAYQSDRGRREALDRLIDQQLAAQMALREGLDRDPDIANRLAMARREALARGYVERMLARLPAPSDEEVRRYYDEHPLLFSQRRYYMLREIALPAKDAPVDALGRMIRTSSVERIAAWLRANGRTHSVSASSRPAEDIPSEVLPVVSRLARGQTTVLRTPDGVFVIHLVSASSAPMDEQAAAPRIRALLARARARDAVGREMALLKSRARIEYAGEFLSPNQSGAAGAVNPARGGSLLVSDAPAGG